jgi:hypothetical protein
MGAHVGLGFSKRHMIFVENNTINNRPVSQCLKKKPVEGSQNNSLDESAKSLSNTYARDTQNNPQISTLLKDSNLFEDHNGSVKNLSEFKKSSKTNRIAEIFEEETKKMNTIDEIKEHINKIDRNNNPYINFVDYEKFNDEQLIEFYKKKRRIITQNLIDLNFNKDNMVNKLPSTRTIGSATTKGSNSARTKRAQSSVPSNNIFKTNKQTIDNDVCPADKELKRILVDGDRNQVPHSSRNNNFHTIDHSDPNNAFGILYPYVNQEFFAKYTIDKQANVIKYLPLRHSKQTQILRIKRSLGLICFRRQVAIIIKNSKNLIMKQSPVLALG